MGLDMFLYKRNNERIYNDITNEITIEPDEELGYWRKFNALHGLILSLTNASANSNCEELDLSLDMINEILDILQQVDALIAPYTNKRISIPNSIVDEVMSLLPPQSGFFFGSVDIDTCYAENVHKSIEIFETAKQKVENGEEVYYYSWW